MKKLLLIVNDRTGNGRNGRFAPQAVRTLTAKGYQVTVFPVTEELQPDLSAYLQETQYDRVVCIGGDGTLSRTINEIMKLPVKPSLGYIPAGTTNDFSRNLNLNSDMEHSLHVVAQEHDMPFDICRFNDRYFNYVASFGAVTSVSHSMDQRIKNIFGYAAYVLGAIGSLSELLSYRIHMKFTTPEKTIEGHYLMGAVANSFSIAGVRLPQLSQNQLHDGSFELFLVKCPDKLQELPDMAFSLLSGKLDNPNIELHHISSCHIDCDPDIAWTLDGEYGGCPESVELEVIPEAIQLSCDAQAE
ncbi:MAG: diacylglycerol kinase family lipid kinase [Erysipelotrichaceae bacterium]|nr:diacylglycerol kinase family lipid kinase [Erysipelotrichaceae bacterium]